MDLVNMALARADGATIHRVRGMVGIYRGCLANHPDIAILYEQALREFARTGKLKRLSIKPADKRPN